MKRSIFVILAGVLAARSVAAQVATCDASGKQAIAHRWDVVLGHEWEMVRDCRHPDWPARAAAVKAIAAIAHAMPVPPAAAIAAPEPPVVHAGDAVTLWQQAAFVRIELAGVAERAARRGERIEVRVTRTAEDGAQTVERIAGTVRAPGNVEMER